MHVPEIVEYNNTVWQGMEMESQVARCCGETDCKLLYNTLYMPGCLRVIVVSTRMWYSTTIQYQPVA